MLFQYLQGVKHFFYPHKLTKSHLKAKKFLEEALASHRQIEMKMAAGQGVIDSELNIIPQVYAMLADIYIIQGNLSKAQEVTTKGLYYNKYNVLLTRCLYKSLVHQDLVEIIQKFNGIYDKMKDSDYLIDVLSDLCQPQFAAYYGRACQQDMNKLKVFLRTDNYSGAAALAGKNLQIYRKFFERSQQGKH